ncbi:hypothetical protein TRFO_25519 [Tritrichomonas foetus]|uniref:non-specific serine/threonine protein kinase n=1 Tax=Tritrichomonas foetus TaxID=1144522 RepID=A0A1J4K6H5_9EUKA|nr:hypothetical protein TRFO_25519 [Tritrichomonas foetus]|eukprot:OHT06488.1 hypothetical protein TRFO_25519 [Tritrichomonas foetus]
MSYNPHALDHFIMPRPSSNSPYLQSASLTNSIYNRVYRSLKSQKTIFITLLERTTNLEKQYQMEFNSLGTENKNHNSNFVNQPQNNIDENEKSPKKLDNHKSTTISKKLNNTQTHSKPENLNNLNIGKNCFSKSDGEALIVYKNIINKILNAFYGNLFQINFANSDQLQEILQNDLSPSTEKLGYKILAACLSIKRLISLLSFTNYAAQTEDIGNEFQFDHFNSYNKEEYPLSPLTNPSPSFEGFPTQVSQATHENNQKVNANNELNKNASTNNEILKNSSWLKTDDDLDNPLSGINKALNTSANVCNCNEMNSSNEFKCNNEEASQFPSVICRICEKEVPLCKIEAHSKSCVIAYESSKSMKSTDDHMRKLQAYAQQTVLHADWPGEEMNAKSVIIPILHVVALLDRAIAVDPHSCGASSELDLICGLLGSVGCIFGNPDASSIVSRAQALSAEKSTASVKLEEAMDIVKLTTNDENTDFKVTTIADFTFIRRISSGAYAKVYLTRRFQTGDLSATKVISRESLQQKNDFQRVMVEKNILAKITNPFMIRFCM